MLPLTGQLFAPAKLTLSLRVLGVRDDGFHNIFAEMVTLDFGDDLHLEPGTDVEYRGVWRPEANGNDLVARALDLLGERRQLTVIKRIPAGAGLGGGSADAAAILAAAGFDDLKAAAALGADVAFSLVGGRAIVEGYGEKVEPVAYRPQNFTLLTPPLSVSTAAVYGAWDRLGGPRGRFGNDLEEAAISIEPLLADWRDRLHRHSGLRPRLAGSGGTWFVEGFFPGDGFTLARATRARDRIRP